MFWLTTVDDPVLVERRKTGAAPKPVMLELSALRDARVWRFAFYYFFVFGAFVALALWLPRYLIGVYGFDIATAGMIAALPTRFQPASFAPTAASSQTASAHAR